MTMKRLKYAVIFFYLALFLLLALYDERLNPDLARDLGTTHIAFGSARGRFRQARKARDREMTELEYVERQNERLVTGFEQAADPAEEGAVVTEEGAAQRSHTH